MNDKLRKTNFEKVSSVCKCLTPSILAFSMIVRSTGSLRLSSVEITDKIVPDFRVSSKFSLPVELFFFLKKA